MKIINFLICDDIRNELGNKNSVMGIYDDSINFNVPVVEKGKWPKVLKLGVLIKAKFESETEKYNIGKFKLDVSLNAISKTIAEGEVKIENSKDAKGINLAVVFNQFLFEGPGVMTFSLNLLDHKNEVVTSLMYPDEIKISENAI